MTYFDPAKGVIPGIAAVCLDYISTSDPAQYNKGNPLLYPQNPKAAWASEHLGKTWWDTSSIRYIDYEQGSDVYRAQNWGKLAPGATVNVYEWVRSPVQPSTWGNFTGTGQTFSQYGLGYLPTGTVRNSSSPAWTQTIEYDSKGAAVTWYYFWVQNATSLPLPPTRNLTTYQIANTITNPSAYGVSWYAAIDPNNIIVIKIQQLTIIFGRKCMIV